jgi:hypothetical protein
VDFLQSGDDLVATSVVVPGQQTFEAAFVYVMPYSGAALELNRPLRYPTASVNGLLLDVGAKMESEALTFGGERTAQGQTFLQYTGRDLKAGDVLPIRLIDLDKVEFASSTPAETTGAPPAGVMPSTGLKQTTLLYLMLGLGAAAVVFGVSYPSLRPRLKGSADASAADLERQRQRLLLTLARLDQAHEDGQLNETAYQRARRRRKAELAEVLRQLEEREF